MHCHHLVAVEDADLGMPEVTLPVVPGMEGCHWPFRKARPQDFPKLLQLLLTGRSVKAAAAVGWLIDAAGPLDVALRSAWEIAANDVLPVGRAPLERKAIRDLPLDRVDLPSAGSSREEEARRAIAETIAAACGSSLAEAILVQAEHSARFMTGSACRDGRIGAEFRKTMIL